MYPLTRQLMARSYLLAALGAGVIIGYVIGRVEGHIALSALAEHLSVLRADSSRTPDSEDWLVPAASRLAAEPVEPDVDDLEHAARRLDERASRADRLGDPELADLWRSEAARLRQSLRERHDGPSSAQVSAIDAP